MFGRGGGCLGLATTYIAQRTAIGYDANPPILIIERGINEF